MEFLHPTMWRDHDIDFARWLHPAMWHVALGSWQWIHRVAVGLPATWHMALGWYVIEFARWHVTLESWQWIRPVAASCNVTRSSGIMTLNSPGGSTLQCGRWQRDGMSLNSPKRPPYWNSTFGFDFGHISAVDMSFCTSLRNFIQIGPTSAKKWRHVDFQDDGSPPSWIFGVQ